jgi:hypothetical protein
MPVGSVRGPRTRTASSGALAQKAVTVRPWRVPSNF